MLELRPDQMQVFLDYVRSSFVDRLAKYLKEQHPTAIADKSATELRTFIEHQIVNAENYGITTEAPVAKFIELVLAYGEGFHNSGAYPEAERILLENSDALTKVETLYASAMRNFEPVFG